MKRITIHLEEIADLNNLALALHKAAAGKRDRDNVRSFLDEADHRLNQLARSILDEQMPYGDFRTFTIFDPKKRLIHAACFPDRVFHHAVMNLAGPVFEKAMVDHSYACRPGKGVHRAVQQVQKNLRRFQWYVQIDIDGYFAAISHSRLAAVLKSRFKGREITHQFQRIMDSYYNEPGVGLPIGSLTSQYFANYFLDGLDRMLQEDQAVRAMVRYMDDIVWWCDSRLQARKVLRMAGEYLTSRRGLTIKSNIRIQRSRQGISYCGFRIAQGSVRLSRRRKRRFQQRRMFWEKQYMEGRLDACQLQTAYSAVHAITAGTDSLAWRRENLRRHPPLDV